MDLYRQGDVLLTRIDKAPFLTPSMVVPRERGRCVLAKGESTGHEHAIPDANVEHFRRDDKQFITIGEPGATLEHDEHGDIMLEPGTYEVTGQREFVPTAERSRAVYD